MLNKENGSRAGILIGVIVGLTIAPMALADDEDDVLAFIQQYGELEDDLDAQASMIRDDRVMITAVRQTDNKKNMTIQKANRAAAESMNGGKTKFVTSIENPHVQVYGDVAVASFMRTFNVYPHKQAPAGGTPQWVTLVLVKERGNWGIAHTHMSSTNPN